MSRVPSNPWFDQSRLFDIVPFSRTLFIFNIAAVQASNTIPSYQVTMMPSPAIAHTKPTPPTAEILALGDELTSGDRLNTNSQWIAKQLSQLGIQTTYHTTVGDDMLDIQTSFRLAMQRADMVIATGGLGPTEDDLTRQALALVVDQPLDLHGPTLRHIENLFAKRKRTMSANNRSQALFPRGCQIVPNSFGTAPGIDFTYQSSDHTCRMICLPGVPSELKRMWREHVSICLAQSFNHRIPIHQFTFHCFGIAESEIESRLPGLIARNRHPLVGITASQSTISLRISAAASTPQAFLELIKPTQEAIRGELQSVVFGENGETLAEVVRDQLKQRDLSIVLIESDLGGQSISSLRSIDDSPCLGGWVLPKLTTSVHLREWAEKAKSFFDADLVLALGSAVTRSSDQPERCVQIHGLGAVKETWLDVLGDPDFSQIRSVKQALNWLRLTLPRPAVCEPTRS